MCEWGEAEVTVREVGSAVFREVVFREVVFRGGFEKWCDVLCVVCYVLCVAWCVCDRGVAPNTAVEVSLDGTTLFASNLMKCIGGTAGDSILVTVRFGVFGGFALAARWGSAMHPRTKQRHRPTSCSSMVSDA